jgi:ApbE superfamily uncharacterized protein (UPF0280 family)
MEYDELAPSIIRDMLAAARKATVGPVAAVADAVAQHVGVEVELVTA